MKKLLLLLLLPAVAFGQPVNPIISGGTSTGGSGGSATNIGVSTSGGLLTTSTNGTGDFTIVLTPAVVGAVTSSNALYAVMATNAISVTNQPIYDVILFGANPNDDVADNVAIQAAIDAASTNRWGGVVYFPQGTNYLLGAMDLKSGSVSEGHPNLVNILSNNITIRGAGMNRSRVTLQATNYSSQVFNGWGGGNTSPFIMGPSNLVFEDIWLDGGMSNQTYCADFTQFYNSQNSTLRRVRISYTREDAIDFHNDLRVYDCEFFNIGNGLGSGGSTYSSIYRNCYMTNLAIMNVDGGEGIGVSGGYLYLDNCIAHNPGKIGVRNGTFISENSLFYFTDTAQTTNFFNENSQSMKFENCIFKAPSLASGFLFTMNAGNLELTDCSIQNLKVLTATNISEFTMLDCTVLALVDGHIFFDGVSSSGNGVRIIGNSFTGNGNACIDAAAGSRRTDNLIIADNRFYQGNVILRSAVSTNWLVQGNNFEYNARVRLWGGGRGYHRIYDNTFTDAACGLDVSIRDCFIRGNRLEGFVIHSTESGGYGNVFSGNNFNQDATGSAPQYTNNNVFLDNFWQGTTNPYPSSLRQYVGTFIGNGAGFTNLPPTTGIAGWPANSSGYLQNNGSGTLSWGNPAGGSVTLTNTTSAAGLVVGGSGSFGIGTNLSSVAGGTNQFWVAASPPNEKYTNLFGDTMEISGAYRVLTVGTNVGNNVQISDGISSFPNGMWIDAGAQEYFVGKISVGTERGQFQLGSGAVSNLTATGTIYAPSNNISGGISAGSITTPQLNAATLYATNINFAGRSNAFMFVSSDGTVVATNNGVTLTNLSGAAFSTGQIYTSDSTNYVLTIGTIYQKISATNNVCITNVSGIGAASLRIRPSGADRCVLMPTNWSWLSTNGFVLANTNWSIYVTNKGSSVGWLSVVSDGNDPTNVVAMFNRTP